VAFGRSGDLEQGTTRNIPGKAMPASSPHDNLTWPDGSPFDPAVMKPEFRVIVVDADELP
jgi:hypothetical protein